MSLIMEFTHEHFIHSLTLTEPPKLKSDLLLALWYDAKDEWEIAHNIAQNIDSQSGALLHAYLHRKEGDLTNAKYWYRLASADSFSGSLEEEWRYLLEKFISL